MTDHRLLVSCPLIGDAMDQYADRLAANGIEYDVADVDQQLDKAALLDRLDGYDAILAGDDELTRTVLQDVDTLQVVVKWGIGTDNVDQEAAKTEGIAVYNTPDAFGAEVADVVVGYVVMLTRRLHRIDTAVRDGEWACPRGTSLAGKTLGVVGVGDIGAAVARRAHAHGMAVLGNDVEPLPAGLQEETGIEPVSKTELFERSDVVSLNCALTPATRDLVGAEELDALGPEGYLVNTARGELVVESALVEALESGTVAGAALDVFREEPLPEDHPLTTFDNVVLGSHNAQNTHEAVSRVNDRAIEKVIDGLSEL